MPDTSTWTQPALVLAAGENIDDIDNHLADCLCDECIDNLILDWVENRRAS